MIGTSVIVRSHYSGVWHGELVKREGAAVELKDARRLWRWWAAKGVSCSGVAVHGLHPDKLSSCKIEPPVPRALITDACEILSASEFATNSIIGQAPAEAA
jgi:hypothetical protein